LFAGLSQGSTTVLVIDIGLFRDVHRRRGFITLAGVGLKEFSYSDVRLKGMTSVCAVHKGCQHGTNGSDSTADVKTFAAVYRLITGKGFCSYHIWEVCLEARCIGTVSSPQLTSGGGLLLSYTSNWRHLYQGSINGPMMDFANFVSPIHSHRAQTDRIRGGADDHDIFAVVGDFQKDLRPICLQRSSNEWISAAGKSSRLKGSTHTLAASSDGMILFGGKYELIVSCYCPLAWFEDVRGSSSDDCCSSSIHPGVARLIGRSVFSISDFLVDAPATRPSRRSSRHMREISAIHCTRDGSYALVQCSDNAVLLFR